MVGLLWIMLILFPLLLGSGILALFYGKNIAYDISVSESCVLGMIICIGASEVVHLAGWFLNWGLRKCIILGGIVIGVMVALSVFVFVIRMRNQFRNRIALCKGYKIEKSLVPFLFLSVVLFQLIFIYSVKPVLTEGDITLETVQSFLAEDGIYRVLPLTGQESAGGVPLRYGILCLPTVYAMLCSALGLNAQLLVCHIIPVAVAGMTYMGYYYLSGILFKEAEFRKRFIFLLALSIIFWFTDTGVFSNGYNLLHSGFLGTSIRNLILVPYLFGALLEKRWWKVVLCILAEACISWTLWGMGVCAAITMGMSVLFLLEKKSDKLHRYLQIFQKKEDLL